MFSSDLTTNSVPHAVGVEVIIDTPDDRLVAEGNKIKNLYSGLPKLKTQVLYFGSRGVELKNKNQIKQNGQRVNFLKIDRRLGSGNLSKKQPLPKAIGPNLNIFDATAGFGGDAAILALIGFNVTAAEQSPIISTLLRDGIYRAMCDDSFKEQVKKRLLFIEGDSIKLLNQQHGVDVVYLDPMFPPKKKKHALPPGHIQTLKEIIGYDNQQKTLELFHHAMHIAKSRVVVKRPRNTEVVYKNPVAIHKCKTVRYEVYKPIN